MFTGLNSKMAIYLAMLSGVPVKAAAATLAQATLGQKIALCTSMLWAQTTAWLSTPIGAISAITIGIFGLVKAVELISDSFDNWEKKVKRAEEALEKNNENIEKYEKEIDSLEQLQEKLQDARGSKEALAKIQGELNKAIGETPGLLNGEASAHEAATQKINDRIAATEKLLAQERKQAVQNNAAVFNNNGIQREFLDADWLAKDTSGDDLRKWAQQRNTLLRDLQEFTLNSRISSPYLR